MSMQVSLPLVQDIEGGHGDPSGSLTVKGLKAILDMYPDDMIIMVRYPSKDFSSETCSALSWAGKDHLMFSEEDNPRYGLYLQPLAPSKVVANREFFKNRNLTPPAHKCGFLVVRT